MLPNPLHPALVHFPLVLAVLLPLFIAGALWAIRRGSAARRAWAVPLACAGLLAASAFAAVRTGEAEEERVEDVVSEAVLHDHEEAAERFLILSAVLALVAVAGLGRGTLARSARLVTAGGSIALLVSGIQTGSAGGDLVYRHNAASVYARPAVQATSAPLDEHE